jgi:MoxR-like ATPase
MVYRGVTEPHDGIDRLPSPPPWRIFTGTPLVDDVDDVTRLPPTGRNVDRVVRARTYRPDEELARMVNAALYLRRPLLVTGKPGTGKSTLAYHIAYELRLGAVLSWPITSRATLTDGLYRYDAIGRLQEAHLLRPVGHLDPGDRHDPPLAPDIGRYLRLGPVGTALLPRRRPRVLLIDELDKSNVDLPNDLLNIFEEGEFEVPELARLPDDVPVVEVMTADDRRVPVTRGRVGCHAFPVVVVTSNGEREFPPAFLRRCLRYDIPPPDHAKLATIVAAQLGEAVLATSAPVIERFLRLRDGGDVATDQLLNAIYLATSGSRPPEPLHRWLADAVMRPLEMAGP